MSVRFLIGRAGTGKTQYCFEQIVERCAVDPFGTPVYWLLPKQATFTAERELTCSGALPGGYARARVVSFEQLGREILAECGGVAIPEIDAVGRRMILGHLLRKHREQLRFFRSVAHQVGLAAELDSAFSEFERCGKSADDLATIVGDLEDECAGSKADASRAALWDKLHDLKLIYESYTSYLGQERLDPHRRLQQVLGCVEKSKQMRGAAVFVDGFYDFTDFERKFLVGVARACERLEIALTMDPATPLLTNPHAMPEELSTFHPIEQTYRQLYFAFNESNIDLDAPMLFKKAQRFRPNSAVEHVEACMFSRRPAATEAHDGLTLIEAPDKRSEVDAAARHIQSLIDEHGLRLREIAVLVRSLEDYHELIDASFREHGLPYFVDRRRGAAHHPLIQLTRSLPALGLHDWDHDAAMTILKTGLIPLGGNDVETLDAADRLENYVLRHRIRGAIGWDDPNRWKYHRTLLDREEDPDARGDASDAADVDPLRQSFRGAVAPAAHITSSHVPAPLRQFVAAIYDVFARCRIRETLARWMDQAEQREQLEQRAEHARMWNELTKLLDEMVELLGDEPVSPSDFVEILDAGLESFDLALTPPTVDQILVGSVDRTRTGPRIKAAVVLGLNEGTFPKRWSENSILCDSERKSLGDRKLDLEPDTKRRLFDERFFAYIGFTRATDFLCVSRPLSDNQGRALSASSFWNALRTIFPSATPQSVPRDASTRPECIGTPRQLVTALLNWARSDSRTATDSFNHDPAWPALYQRLAQHAVTSERDAIDVMRYRAWRALSYRNDAELSPDVAAGLYPNPLQASVSRIETFATCPFRHFARYGLKLTEREEEDVTALDLGNVYHKVLEGLVKSFDFTSADPQRTTKRIAELAEQVGQSLRDELLLSTARNQYLLEHARRTIEQVVEGQREAANRGKFRPWRAEVSFGGRHRRDGDLPPLALDTPEGKRVELHGKIDRVDLIENEAAAAVIDYKLSGNKLDVQRVYHGLSLQLLTYLLVLDASGEQLAGRKLTPAAAFYVQLMRKLEAVAHPDDATAPEHPDFPLSPKPRGMFDGDYLRAIDPNVTPGTTSSVVSVRVLKDGGFGKGSDAVDAFTFESLLRFVEKRIGELADSIMTGDIRVAPYRIGLNTTPCPRCEYRAVCRFDPAREDYRFLEPASVDDVIADLKEAPDG